ncbi:MAG: hypothetical protein ACAH83_04785 [Alphaproteobacteria bacterium]
MLTLFLGVCGWGASGSFASNDAAYIYKMRQIYKGRAEQGDAKAMYELGSTYCCSSVGEPPNYVEAFFWWSLAFKSGPPPGVDQKKSSALYVNLKDHAEKHLTNEQKAEVQKRLANWKPSIKRK